MRHEFNSRTRCDGATGQRPSRAIQASLVDRQPQLPSPGDSEPHHLAAPSEPVEIVRPRLHHSCAVHWDAVRNCKRLALRCVPGARAATQWRRARTPADLSAIYRPSLSNSTFIGHISAITNQISAIDT